MDIESVFLKKYPEEGPFQGFSSINFVFLGLFLYRMDIRILPSKIFSKKS